MKTLIATLIVLSCFSGTCRAAGGTVNRVVVYADRAEVTRSMFLTCKNAKADAVFERLPTTIDVRTLRAEASGKAKAIGTSSRVVALEENRDERVAKLRVDLRKIDGRIRKLQDERNAIDMRMQGLGNYSSYFQQLVTEQARSAKPDISLWSKVLDTFRKQRLDAADQQRKLTVSLRKLNRERELIQRNIQTLAPSSVAEGLRVQVSVDCKGEQRPRVDLSYVVPGATWHPEYDLRFVPIGASRVGRGRAELTVGAVVQQSTGEDWSDVKLLLSTAKPKLGAQAPYPARIMVDGHKAGEQKVLVQAMEKRDKLHGSAAETQGGPRSASLEDRGQSFVLTLPRKVTVHSDGRPYWMPVDVISTRAEAKLVTVPKLSRFVYQVVQLKNPAPYPLLAGRVHSYRKGSFVGDAYLEYKAAGEPMEVSLGVDELLKVERRPLKDSDSKPGAFSSTRKLEQSWWIQVTNTAKRMERVEVRESIPVSKIEDVKVELNKDKTTKGYDLDSHRGFITWSLDIARGGKKNVQLSYTIKLPDDWKVR